MMATIARIFAELTLAAGQRDVTEVKFNKPLASFDAAAGARGSRGRMRLNFRSAVSVPSFCLGSLLLVAACSKPTVADTGANATAAATTAAASKHGKACDMVTAAEMSTILGGPVIAAAGGNERPPSSTECIYSPIDGSDPANAELPDGSATPYAEVQVDWGGGDAKVLDTATGLANAAAPVGAVDPLKGLGDRAYKVTADQVFISTHGDLMMIRFLRKTGEVNAKARRIYDTAKGRI